MFINIIITTLAFLRSHWTTLKYLLDDVKEQHDLAKSSIFAGDAVFF